MKAKDKKGTSGAVLLVLVMIMAFVGALVADSQYMPKYKQEFLKYEKERIAVSNKLNTAQIVQENLNHVRDLIFSNITFPGQPDTVDHETQFFRFITESVEELKLKLVSVKPAAPTTSGRVTTYAYDIEVEGDFFKFGELAAKFENNRRIISIESFDVDLIAEHGRGDSRAVSSNINTENKDIRVRMKINTYRVSK